MNQLTDRINEVLKQAGAEKAFMICRNKQVPMPPDVQIRPCFGCSTDLMVSPSSIAAGSAVTLVCAGCAQLFNVGAESIMCITKEAVKEIEKQIGHTPSNEELNASLEMARAKCGLAGSKTKIV